MPPEPSSLLRWAFHSPIRLASVGVLVASTVVACVLLAAGSQHGTNAVAAQQPTRSASPNVPPATPSISTPSPGETVHVAQQGRIRAAARAFVDAWVSDGRRITRPAWLRKIRPLTTASLFRGLAATDPARLPPGQVQRVQLERIGPFAATAVVTLNSGLQVQVELLTEHSGWVVADVRPAGT
jgi:hypothetical protein